MHDQQDVGRDGTPAVEFDAALLALERAGRRVRDGALAPAAVLTGVAALMTAAERPRQGAGARPAGGGA